MTDSPPAEPRARSKSPVARDRDDRKGREDSFRENSDRRQHRDRSWSRDRNQNRDRRDSPPRRPRERSRSPARRPRGTGGFRFKGDRRDNDRNRDFRRRSPQRHRDRDGGRDRNYRRDDRDGDRGGRDRPRDGDRDQRRERKEKKEEKPKPAVAQGGEEMIIVNVNDRLGTKAAVPCLESDTVGQLKLMVAARIGRDPGQIILKRQSERPFKDHITLGDYGISNGVQLDLEIDTRD
ncbi:ubiquitin-like modifier hub1 [Fusarium equiseti]|uniref:Ubiquitin-like modifier HUB1 n=1 Tax=Fusarium equiseti TaxID=61235 RepID=A0ABQ8RD43_FUSEQ|nr:ubiquitin-like modifier hub1 [Fusarium equiseti]